MANRHMKRCSKTTNYQRNANQNYITLVRMAMIKTSTKNKHWGEHEEKRNFLHCWWEFGSQLPRWCERRFPQVCYCNPKEEINVWFILLKIKESADCRKACNVSMSFWFAFKQKKTQPKGIISESRSVMSCALWPNGLYSPWNSLGQNTGVGSLSLLQGIFPTQGSNPGLLHCRWILYQLSHNHIVQLFKC